MASPTPTPCCYTNCKWSTLRFFHREETVPCVRISVNRPRMIQSSCGGSSDHQESWVCSYDHRTNRSFTVEELKSPRVKKMHHCSQHIKNALVFWLHQHSRYSPPTLLSGFGSLWLASLPQNEFELKDLCFDSVEEIHLESQMVLVGSISRAAGALGALISL